jgi:hypothetical protein
MGPEQTLKLEFDCEGLISHLKTVSFNVSFERAIFDLASKL